MYFYALYNVSVSKTDMDNIFEELEKNFLQNFCKPHCPLECTQNLFKTSVSFNPLNGNKFIANITNNPKLTSDFLNGTIDLTTVEKSIVSVKIFYGKLSYIETTESPQMDGVSLLASIGGNLGLFLGVSMFSVCELVTTLIEVYFYKKQSGKVA